MRDTDRLMSRPETAEYLGVSERTLANWAYEKRGPKFRKVGRNPSYWLSDVTAWVDAQDSGGGEIPKPRRSSR